MALERRFPFFPPDPVVCFLFVRTKSLFYRYDERGISFNDLGCMVLFEVLVAALFGVCGWRDVLGVVVMEVRDRYFIDLCGFVGVSRAATWGEGGRGRRISGSGGIAINYSLPLD